MSQNLDKIFAILFWKNKNSLSAQHMIALPNIESTVTQPRKNLNKIQTQIHCSLTHAHTHTHTLAYKHSPADQH